MPTAPTLLLALALALASLTQTALATVVSVTGAPTFPALRVVRPGDRVALTARLRYAPPPSAGAGARLVCVGTDYWTNNVSLAQLDLVHTSGRDFAMPVRVPVPWAVGRVKVQWRASWDTAFTVNGSFEISCTDGIACNGYERFVYPSLGGKPVCKSHARALCDDGIPCTIDKCVLGQCNRTRNPVFNLRECPLCKAAPAADPSKTRSPSATAAAVPDGLLAIAAAAPTCVPQCKLPNGQPRKCGFDPLCNTRCGTACTLPGTACLNGQGCGPVPAKPGTCRLPNMAIQNAALKFNFTGSVVVEGNTKDGFSLVRPVCNGGAYAREVMYRIKVPSTFPLPTVSLDVVMTSISPSWANPILQLIEVNPLKYPAGREAQACADAEEKPTPALVPACNDDANRRLSRNSRIKYQLKRGFTYFLQADTSNPYVNVSFALSVRMSQCYLDQCRPDCPCPVNQTCQAGTCRDMSVNGTCWNPAMDVQDQATALDFNGKFSVYGDNEASGHSYIQPLCGGEDPSKEVMYRLDVPLSRGFVGLDARVVAVGEDGKDKVMQLIEVDPSKYPTGKESKSCDDANLESAGGALVPSCNDDATPPGMYGSRVTWMLKAGYTYFIQVDGYNADQGQGPFRLDIILSPDCVLACDGAECGDGGCLGFSCGTCPEGNYCTTLGTCQNGTCVPQCETRQCGDDGCGGTCGTCNATAGELCMTESQISPGTCKVFPKCDSWFPTCSTTVQGQRYEGCPGGFYCTTECKCAALESKAPDLVVGSKALQGLYVTENFVAEPSSCALREGCLGGIGSRRILEFDTLTKNQGTADFMPPNPPSEHPERYEWGACHGHFHFSSFARYFVRNITGGIVGEGSKRAFCSLDSGMFQPGPDTPCQAQWSCDRQGISRGWMDIYGIGLDCQWVDITHLPPGKYVLEVCLNYERVVHELSYDNNCATAPFAVKAGGG